MHLLLPQLSAIAWPAVLIAALASVLIFLLRWPIPAVLGACAVIGAVVSSSVASPRTCPQPRPTTTPGIELPDEVVMPRRGLTTRVRDEPDRSRIVHLVFI